MKFLILFASFISISLQNDICYNDYGCFTTRPPFSGTLARPIAALPEAPSSVATKFYLYTRSNPQTHSEITKSSANAYFSPARETKFIVHGFLHHGFKQWVIDIKDALLRAGDYNVISVDWSKGNGFPYTQATANTQIVGADIAFLIESLISRHSGLTASKFHIIGHSLGSHIAGYAGQRLNGALGRISGLDPAGPYFENTDPVVRLDSSDAQFVDVLHTDGAGTLKLGLGLMQPLGHVDFYPNGGKDQPGCPANSDKLLSGIFNLATVNIVAIDDVTCCSHTSSLYYYRDSIENQNCSYIAYPCANKDAFDVANCLTCSSRGCNRAGFWASKSRDTGMLFYNTQPANKYPYCQLHYKITLNSNSLAGQTQARGLFTISLNGNLGKTDKLIIDDSDNTFKLGSSYTILLPSNKNPGNQIQSAQVTYTKTSNLLSSFLYQNDWSFSSIELEMGDYQTKIRLCPSQTYLTSGTTATFNKC
jgi:pimeloyl-ACP methyl ester carboxylesterase